MGERANIVVKQYKDCVPVWIYAHWDGADLRVKLKTALARKQRWNEAAYLTRIIVSEVIRNALDEETGYGITTTLTDNSYPILVVDPNEQTVSLYRASRRKSPNTKDFDKQEPMNRWKFDEYIAQKDEDLLAIE